MTVPDSPPPLGSRLGGGDPLPLPFPSEVSLIIVYHSWTQIPPPPVKLRSDQQASRYAFSMAQLAFCCGSDISDSRSRISSSSTYYSKKGGDIAAAVLLNFERIQHCNECRVITAYYQILSVKNAAISGECAIRRLL